jgi:hypothetical protein
MEAGIVHDYRIPFRYGFKQTVFKPAFKKGTVSGMPVTFNRIIAFAAPGADDVYPLELFSSLGIFNSLSTDCAGIFPL